MKEFFQPLMLARLQFAVTTLFHILWPLLSIGLSLFMVLTEAAWLKTGKEAYYRHSRFWGRLFLLTFGLGVASGLPLEFQFGTNWAPFSRASNGFFGSILGFEAGMAFMLESVFLGISLFGWNRVSRRMHLAATAMVCVGASLSAFWIMAANSWMQTPAGTALLDGKIVITDYAAALFNPSLSHSFWHMWVACLETTLFFVAGISAWRILRNNQRSFYLLSFKLALAAAVLVTPLQIYLGDLTVRRLAATQPEKVAAMEAHWETNAKGQGAAWAVLAWPDRDRETNVWAWRIPYLLSVLETHSLTGSVTGLRRFPREERPPIVIPFYSFRIMVGIGLFMAGLTLWALWRWWKGRLEPTETDPAPWFWRSWTLALPLGFIATQLGWATREVGRQPWVIYHLQRTSDGVSNLGRGQTAVSLVAFTAAYLLLLVLFIVFAVKIVRQGPDLTSPLPNSGLPGRRGGA